MSMQPTPRGTVLVTGATGYIGGRLVPRLLQAGWRVRCLVRDPARLEGRPWRDAVDVVRGDVLEAGTLAPALRGVDATYYLVHSLGGGEAFHERDLRAARTFATAAAGAGVSRVIYLGGLADASTGLSEHLRSRQLTGNALREAGVPVTEFRASVIVGSGSVSFEMIRYLTERVPVMVCPRWVYTPTQPIGIREVLQYLVGALDQPESVGRVLEIGGADQVTYGEMMTTYAAVRGLNRILVSVPVLTPRLSSLWVNLVTPIPGAIARPLIEGLRNASVVHDPSARQLFPGIVPSDYRTAVERALATLDASAVETAWSDALSTSLRDAQPVVLAEDEGMIVERRQCVVAATPDAVFRTFTGIGGARGWFYFTWAWQVRGFLDRLIGGVGLRRGRRDPDHLRVGDALDFWRVEAVEPGASLLLRAEMRLPGQAWLRFTVAPHQEGALLRQTAFYAPKGLLGLVYWYAIYPFHKLIFSGMIRGIADRAESRTG